MYKTNFTLEFKYTGSRVEQKLSVFLEVKRAMVFGSGNMCSCSTHDHQNSVNRLIGIYLLGYLPNALTLYVTGLPYS